MMKPDQQAIFQALHKAYGPLAQRSVEPPVDVLIRTILSQNTSDINSNRAYAALRRKFPKWIQVMKANPRKVAGTIRAGGLANTKTKYIQKTLQMIYHREGRISLSRLKALNTAKALKYLTSLPGVGIKTACCVLLFSFNRPVIPVDTHIYRVAGRLGWVGSNTPVDDVHLILESIIPKRWFLPMHLYLIEHGRAVCRPRKPECGRCLLARHCSFFRT